MKKLSTAKLKLLQKEDSEQRSKLRESIFMRLAQQYSELSTCLSRKVGGVLVKDGRVLSIGYNGSPRGFVHCKFTGCRRSESKSGDNLSQCVAIHCETNIISSCARAGINVNDSILYITCTPCNFCARALIAAGIKKVVYIEKYNDNMAIELMERAGIELVHFKGVAE